jgi:hypothetical protein
MIVFPYRNICSVALITVYVEIQRMLYNIQFFVIEVMLKKAVVSISGGRIHLVLRSSHPPICIELTSCVKGAV